MHFFRVSHLQMQVPLRPFHQQASYGLYLTAARDRRPRPRHSERDGRMSDADTGRSMNSPYTRLDGATAMVTGAARGIGRACALRLGRLGADVALVDIDLDSAAEFGEILTAPSVADEIRALGRRSIGITADVSCRDDVDEAVKKMMLQWGRIDILVNNVGGATTPVGRSSASLVPEEDIEALVKSNLMTTIHCSQAVIPVMRAQGKGVIVNVSTRASVTTHAEGSLAHHAFTKAAVNHYTRYLAAEVGPLGIRVNCMVPGPITTARIVSLANERRIGESSEAAKVPLRRLGTAEDCANVLEFLATDLSGFVTGQCICVCGGLVLTPS